MIAFMGRMIVVSLALMLHGCRSIKNSWIVGAQTVLSYNDRSDFTNAKAVFAEFMNAWISEDYNKVYTMIHPKCRYSNNAQRKAWETIAKYRRRYGIIGEIYQNSKELSSVKFGRHMSEHDRALVRSMDDFKERYKSILGSIRLIRKAYKRENVIELLYYLTNGNTIFDREINQRLWPDRVMFISFQLSKIGDPSVMVLIKDKGKWYPTGTPGDIDAYFNASNDIDIRPVDIRK